jgi:hypothetical protein
MTAFFAAFVHVFQQLERPKAIHSVYWIPPNTGMIKEREENQLHQYPVSSAVFWRSTS